jgi:hypothetical protein
MRINVHAHYSTDEYLDLLAQQLGKTDTDTRYSCRTSRSRSPRWTWWRNRIRPTAPDGT